MIHIFSLVCFLIYGVKSGSGHNRSKIVFLPASLFKPKCGLSNRIIRMYIYIIFIYIYMYIYISCVTALCCRMGPLPTDPDMGL